MVICKKTLGEYRTNCYTLKKNNDVIIIDPGDFIEVEAVKAVLITHYHFDHIGGLDNFKNIKVYDYKTLGVHEVGDFKFEVIAVPGHDQTCVMFKFDEDMFTGDFLFKGTIGRCDLETSDCKKMKQSLELIKKYDDLNIYPGHGHSTTLKYEKVHNPYLNDNIEI